MKCIALINNKLTRGAINSYKMYTYKVNKGYENASLDTRIFS